MYYQYPWNRGGILTRVRGESPRIDSNVGNEKAEVMEQMVDSLFAGIGQLCANWSRNCMTYFYVPLMIASVGCGSDLPKLYRVSGTVTLNGEPLAAGHVALYPDGARGSSSQDLPVGMIQDGKYEILSGKRSGASAGPYKVVVTATNYSGANAPPMGGTAVPVRSLIDAEYSTRSQTPLALEVVAEPAAGAYDLKVTKQRGREKR